MNTLDKIEFAVFLTLVCAIGLIMIIKIVHYLVKVVQVRKRKEEK